MNRGYYPRMPLSSGRVIGEVTSPLSLSVFICEMGPTTATSRVVLTLRTHVNSSQHLACSRHLPITPPCLFLSHQDDRCALWELLWARGPRCMGSCRLDGALPALTSHYSRACSEFLQTLYKASSSSSLCFPGGSCGSRCLETKGLTL